jgi:triphosphoribosyl-dephospho-CoA synthetase
MHVVNEGWDDGLAGLALRCVGLHVPSSRKPQYWVTQQRLLRHANRCRVYVDGMSVEEGHDLTMMDAMQGLGDLYADQGKLGEAEKMYERALNGYASSYGSDFPQCHSLRRSLVKLRKHIVSQQ